MKKQAKKTPKNFTVEFERETDKRWIADVPMIPGVMAYGRTKEEAKQKVFAVALRTLADRVERGRIPTPIMSLFKHEMARG